MCEIETALFMRIYFEFGGKDSFSMYLFKCCGEDGVFVYLRAR